MPIDFTPHQREALDRQGHLAVTANAGAGKTRVLVERFVRVVSDGVPVSAVVALTYTEKAASELRRKIAERIAGALAMEREPARRTRFEEIRDGLNGAFIGTIHSFCRRILREFPVESGVDAEFTVLDRADANSIIGECHGDAIRIALRGEAAEISREKLLNAVRELGKSRFLALLRALVKRTEVVERLTREGGIYSQADGEIITLWRTAIEEAVLQELSAPSLLGDLHTLVDAALPARGAELQTSLADFTGAQDLPAKAKAFESLADQIFTGEGRLRKLIFGKEELSAHRVACAERVVERRTALAPLLGQISPDDMDAAHRRHLETTRVLLSVARLTIQLYGSKKEDDATLDFDDLQTGMRRLLQNPAVREQLSNRFQFVMIDEYQDTNTLQLEILLPLLNNLAAGNLFIVGDPKQSIYRFRGADAGIFVSTRETIARAAGQSSGVTLGESFRPLRDIAAFVNLVFSHLMQPERVSNGPNDSSAVPQKPGVQGSNPALYNPLIVARSNDAPGRVELLLPQQGPAGEAREHEILARRLLALVQEGTPVVHSDGQPGTISFRDIAILLRDREKLEDLEQTLARCDIPYLVSGGIGYFQTQDVYDIYNYLSFLLNSGDDVALAGILRSPMFSVSDAELFRLARSRREGSLWNALRAPGDPAGRIPSLSRAARILHEDTTSGTRLPVPELLDWIIRRTNLRSVLPGTARGMQAIANLDKLLSMARGFESQGFTSLYDFVERLRALIDEEEREGQATVESRGDALQVMTVHAAKGLEFPVVVVPHLQKNIRHESEPFLDLSLGIGLKASSNPLSGLLSTRSRRQALEEETRIFYVACTRARDHLILSADLPKRKGGDSWLQMLSEAVEEAGGSLSGDELSFTVTTERYRDGQTSLERHALRAPIIRVLDQRPQPRVTAVPGSGKPRINIDPIVSRPSGEIFSASKVRTYIECPSKYFIRYVLGFPGGNLPFLHEEENELHDAEYPAELRGRVFHAVMERVSELSLNPDTVTAAVQSVVDRTGVVAGVTRESLIGDVASLVNAAIASETWREIQAGSENACEISISAALGDDFLIGTIDHLYRSPDGCWTILDYKTDAVGENELSTRAEAYWPQLDFYAVMVSRLKTVDRIRLRLLFASQPQARLERMLTQVDLRKAEEEIALVIAHIKAEEFAAPQRACPVCPFSPGGCWALQNLET